MKTKPDDDNPEFAFTDARPWREGDPVAPSTARLVAALRQIAASATIADAQRIAQSALDDITAE